MKAFNSSDNTNIQKFKTLCSNVGGECFLQNNRLNQMNADIQKNTTNITNIETAINPDISTNANFITLTQTVTDHHTHFTTTINDEETRAENIENDISNNLATLQNTVIDLLGNVEEGELNTLKKLSDALNDDADFFSTVATNTTTATTNSNDLATLQTIVADISTNFTTNTLAAVTTLNATNTDISNNLATLSANVTSHIGEYNSHKTSSDNHFDHLYNDVHNRLMDASSNPKLLTTVNDISANLATLETTVTDLSSDLEGIAGSGSVGELAIQSTDISNNLATLSADVTSHISEYNSHMTTSDAHFIHLYNDIHNNLMDASSNPKLLITVNDISANLTTLGTSVTDLSNNVATNTAWREVAEPAVVANTAKVGYTNELVAAAPVVTDLSGIVHDNSTNIISLVTSVTSAQLSSNTNTAWRLAVAPDISVNTAKVGYTNELVAAAPVVTDLSGIVHDNSTNIISLVTSVTSAQLSSNTNTAWRLAVAPDISVNTAKVGYTNELVAAAPVVSGLSTATTNNFANIQDLSSNTAAEIEGVETTIADLSSNTATRNRRIKINRYVFICTINNRNK